ncbi:MAG TPA: hypothetical protein VFR31_04855, partial [Thermoanaerobaculia bacterium]|nr:hypothetical protein [Thermoanaerobaculia bacterium]
EETEKQTSSSSQQSSSSGSWWSGWGSGGSSSSSQSSQSSSSTSFKTKNVEIATVDARYASAYNYAVEASSVVKTKIVPVPPPTIFEEIVRAKLQERREGERRLRLNEEAKAAFLAQMGAVDATLAKLSDISTMKNEANKAKAMALREAAARLQERHGSLTNEHWALTRSVEDREAADGRMNAIVARANELRAFFGDDADADPAALSKALQGELTAYKTIADSLRKRLAAAGTPAPP